jgi:long-chain acyl-CoA synthetase
LYGTDAQNILLTGTGMIGRELLAALVRDSSHKVFVLMRDRGRRSADQRGARLLDELTLTAEERARVEVLRGDVTASDFGLDSATVNRLARTLNLLIHTAATTSLTADRFLCESVNLTGTANALILAERCFAGGRLRRFVHLSTAFVAGGGSNTLVREDELPVTPAHVNHYEWSKYEAERLVRAAMHAGLPMTIFRPSMVVGESATGRTRHFNVIYPLMRMIASGYLTRLPANPQARVHLAPIDFVVEAIKRGMKAEWADGLTFHLTTPKPPTLAELIDCDAFFPDGVPGVKLCPPDEFDLSSCCARESELLASLAFCFPYFNSRVTFATTNTARLIELPATDAGFLRRLGQYAVTSGYIRPLAALA